MAIAISFDTLKFSRALTKAGFTEIQAYTPTQMQKEIIDEGLGSDISKIKEDISNIKLELSKLEFLIKTFGGAIFATLLGILLKMIFFN